MVSTGSVKKMILQVKKSTEENDNVYIGFSRIGSVTPAMVSNDTIIYCQPLNSGGCTVTDRYRIFLICALWPRQFKSRLFQEV